jgi:mannose-1-phosphate guanylyltransferase / phosphomannomutase
MKLKAVVMAGGEGSRLRPLTVNRPKPLVPVANRPIMEHILRLLAKHGITEVLSTLYYLSDSIVATFGDGSELGISLTHSLETTPLGTAGAVKKAEENLRDSAFIIISGDALTSLDLQKAVEWHKAKGSVATLILKRVDNPLDFGVVITDEEGRIQRFLEKPGWSEVFSDTVNTGIYIIEPEVLDMMEPGVNYDWSQDIFPRLLREGAPLFGYITDEYWSDIGALDQYREAQVDILSGSTGLEVPGIAVQPGVWVGADTIIEDGVHLVAPLCIGGSARIRRGAVVGPYTVVGDGCIIESGAVLDRCVLWEGSYIGPGVEAEGAIIGSHAIVKKDSILREDVVVGDRTRVDVGCLLKTGVKVWPDRQIERGSTLTMSLVSGSRWRGSLFRDLGVAGISNIEITPEFVSRLGLAYGTTLPIGARVITARDSTRSSRMVKRAVIASLLSTGSTVIDMRSCPVPITRHHARAIGAHGALSVRKMPGTSRLSLVEFFDSHGDYLSSAQRRKVEANFYREEFRRTDSNELGMIELASRAVELYEHDFFEALGKVEGKRRRIVVDYGFSSISPIYPAFLQRLGVDVISLNSVNDAKAAPRTPQEIEEHLRNVAQIASLLRADLGVLFTNEGEKMRLVDDQGIPLSGLQLLGAVATLVAASEPHAKIALSLTTPTALIRHLEAMGATCVLAKTGIRDLMQATRECSFGGDDTGGFIFPTLTPGFDAMFAFASLLARLDSTGRSLSEIAASLPELHLVQEAIPCPYDKKGLVMRVMQEELAKKGDIELSEGVRVTMKGGWALVLPDTFEPLVHVYSEGATDGDAMIIVEEIKARVRELRNDP